MLRSHCKRCSLVETNPESSTTVIFNDVPRSTVSCSAKFTWSLWDSCSANTLVLHNRESDFHVNTIVLDRGSITNEYEKAISCSYILKHFYYNLRIVLKQNKSITNCRMNKYLKRKNANENEKASNEKLNSVMRHYSDSYISF